MIRLEISENSTRFDHPSAPNGEIRLPLGFGQLARQFFGEFPPTYAQIDHAIQYTEDELATIEHAFDGESSLTTDDERARQIARLAFDTVERDGQLILPREELESVFNRLADIVKGLPASQDVIPTETEFAAYLLILREITHHLAFDEVILPLKTT
ncbi:hypothetical protein [Ruficoccus sp. ZRK36]|uniref:hypothetical protein n=1 Tax=Ruficoccus sp. ZRK36 TaxID=2866311 RepID=UPI001C73D2A6|nr:hypothetical protein [Ruficoccus sp. ZRK36]QYY34929.1 hypothetical protein K0V07_11525 [Ruficoccus sp. ZRK36]